MFWIGLAFNTVFLWLIMFGAAVGNPITFVVGLLGMLITLNEVANYEDSKTGVLAKYTYNRYV